MADLLAALRAHAEGSPASPPIDAVAALLRTLPRALPGPPGVGQRTGWLALPLDARAVVKPGTLASVDHLPVGDDEALVWPGYGQDEGRTLTPLTPEAADLARANPDLARLLAAVDAYRTGRARERLAVEAWLGRELRWALPLRRIARAEGWGCEVEALATVRAEVRLRLTRGTERFDAAFDLAGLERAILPPVEVMAEALRSRVRAFRS